MQLNRILTLNHKVFQYKAAGSGPAMARPNFQPIMKNGLLNLYHTIPIFNDPKEKGFGKPCGKRRKCWQPAFSLFPTGFSILAKREIVIFAMFNLSSANAFNSSLSQFSEKVCKNPQNMR